MVQSHFGISCIEALQDQTHTYIWWWTPYGIERREEKPHCRYWDVEHSYWVVARPQRARPALIFPTQRPKAPSPNSFCNPTKSLKSHNGVFEYVVHTNAYIDITYVLFQMHPYSQQVFRFNNTYNQHRNICEGMRFEIQYICGNTMLSTSIRECIAKFASNHNTHMWLLYHHIVHLSISTGDKPISLISQTPTT